MTYRQAIQYLQSLIDYERRPEFNYSELKLDRIRSLLERLGNPQDKFPSIHVAGTKGKGSTCAFIYSILKAHGFRVGLYTSPHLVSFRERIRIGDALISPHEVAKYTSRIKGLNLQMRPSFFEVYTALAFAYFAEKGIDVAVVEVGLGGRLDATNVLEPLVSVITPISFDHTQLLGDTLTQIAREKAGIIKRGVPVVMAPQDQEVMKVLRASAKEKDALLVGTKRLQRFRLSLLGKHQLVNANVALRACRLALERLRPRIKLSMPRAHYALAHTKWPGRLEVVARSPLVVLDGAQNRASARALAAAISESFRFDRLILIFGMSKGKDIIGTLMELFPLANDVVLTQADNPRAASAKEIYKVLERSGASPVTDVARREVSNGARWKDKDIKRTFSLKEALRIGRKLAGKGDLVLITGSLFLVGEAKKYTDGHNRRNLNSGR